MVRVLVICVLVSAPAFAQVRVDIRPEKPSFLEGEPVYLVADITNIGQYPIGFGAVGHDLEFAIDGMRPYPWRERCANTVGYVGHPVIDHLPTMAPGRTHAFRYVLRGYRLRPGTHQLRVSGEAPVDWYTEAPILRPNEPSAAPIPHRRGDTVEGALVDHAVRLTIQPSTEQDLRAVFEPLVRAAQSTASGILARAGIYEMAPPFLVDTIAEMARDSNSGPGSAYLALSDINTPSARAHLRRLHDDSRNLGYRVSIVRALALTGDADNLEFFVSLLPGRSAEPDDRVRREAIHGLGCIGGDRAAAAIGAGTRSTAGEIRRAAVYALGSTSSRVAVPLIIEAAGRDRESFDTACEPLRTLTHYDWCHNDSGDQETLRRKHAQWMAWWKRNGSRLPIYSPKEEPPSDATLPKVQ